MRKTRIELGEVIDDAVHDVIPILAEHGHEFIVCKAAEPVWLEADSSRLQQVLSNLLRNAINYTDAGGRIELTVERGRSTVVLHVRDSGDGIEPDALDHIFDLFTQVRRRETGGLGIGLSVVRQLVTLHDGTIEARSAGLGKGSEFVVTLPVLSEAAAG
jgi:signal transduction histidine kinase